jgi:uncharacterized protein (DUF302 family)
MRRTALCVIVPLVLAIAPAPSAGQEGRITAVSKAPFAHVATALERAIADEKLALVCHANAQRGAQGRGVSIKGNQVMMVFRNDLAVRLIGADPGAAFEAPMRIYVYENADGTATVTYVPPSVLLAPYRHPAVRAVGAELDPVFKRIVDQALASR